MSQQNLLNFLKLLAQDAHKKAEFDANPSIAMRDAGLTSEQQELILSGNITALKNEFGEGNWTPFIEIFTFRSGSSAVHNGHKQ